MKDFTTILDTLDQHRDNGHIALICGDETLTYRQLIADAKHIARGLLSEGVKRGDRVLFCMNRTADAIRAWFGILYAGAAYVAADTDWPRERLEYARKETGAVFSMTDETCAALRKKKADSLELPCVEGEDEMAIYFTSGSTGEPKGVVLHHISFGSAAMGDPPRQQCGEIFCLINKFAYIITMINTFTILSAGKTMLLATDGEQAEAGLLAEAMLRYRADTISGTPSVFLRFLEHPEFARAFAELTHLSLLGERMVPSLIRRITDATGARLIFDYGTSEMPQCAEYCYRGDGKIHLGKAGYRVRLYLLDENMEEIRPGEEGELFIGGVPAAHGHYLNRPDLDAEKYVEDSPFGRLFRTGDIVRLDMDGEITLIGRKDDMVKLHGQRIEIGEVENAIAGFQGIRSAAVRLIGDAPNEMLVGYYTVFEEISEAELRRSLAERLPYYMIPSLFMKLDAMPENANGKLDYRALPHIEPPKREYVPPETEEEKLLCEIFAEVTKCQTPVGVNDSFFDLGGDSISAMLAAARLRQRGVTFEVRQLFGAPAPRLLAPLLTNVTETEDAKESAALPLITQKQREAADRVVGHENVECIYPVTTIVENGQSAEPDYSYPQPYFWELRTPVSADELKARTEELAGKHQALRSVLVLPEEGRPVQVVLKEPRFEFFHVDLRALSEGEGLSVRQKDYFSSFMQMELAKNTTLGREVLFRVGLIRISEHVSIIYIGTSHWFLEGGSVYLLFRELIGRLEAKPDADLFKRRIVRLYSRDRSTALAYWRKLLEGRNGMTRLPVRSEYTDNTAVEQFLVAGGRKLQERAYAFCRAHHYTISALMTYALGKALMRVLAVEEVCFCSIGSGREPEDSQLPGMFVVPFPVRLHSGDSIYDCQEQLLRSAPHAWIWGISDSGLPVAMDEGSIGISVQNYYTGLDADCRNIKPEEFVTPNQARKLWNIYLMHLMKGFGTFLMLQVNVDESLSYIGAYPQGQYAPEFMREFSQELINQLRSIVKED